MRKIFFLTLLLTSFFDLNVISKETSKSKDDTNKKIIYLEKKLANLEKKIDLLENKIRDIAGENEEIKLTIKSLQILKGATKQGIKLDINIDNLTNDTIDFIFGNIKLVDNYGDELYADKFYFDQPILPLSYSQTIIMIDSSYPNFEKIKNATNIKLKFIPSKIIKKEKKK